METWIKSNKMIRKIGEKEDPQEYLKQCTERLITMEQLASTHIAWYTHKNPYGCWICDLIQLTYGILETFGEFLGPDSETQDTETTKSSTSEEL